MLSLAAEILILVYQQCEKLTQACALASTNVHLYQVWQICRPYLATRLAQNEIVGFEEALLAVSVYTCSTTRPTEN